MSQNAEKALVRRVWNSIASFGGTFWATIVNEMFERGAWYGFFSLAAIFLLGPTGEGALGLSHAEKGFVVGIVPFFVYLVPLVSGTLADKYGYKKVLLASFMVLSLGYFLMSLASGYYSVLAFFMLVGLGAGLFKPVATGTIARVTQGDKRKSSIGFGIFYMIINVGGFLGPIIAGMFRPTVAKDGTVTGSWNHVFYLSASYMAVMFLFTLFFYREPAKPKGYVEKSIGTKFKELLTDLKDWKLTVLLVIFVGFWTMFMQLFLTLPTWIEEWVDTSVLATYIPFESWLTHGQVKPEFIVNLDAFAIICLNLVIAALIAKYNILKTISVGIMISALGLAGLVLASTHSSGSNAQWYLLLMIFTFAVGEMMSSPKWTELMGRIAPAEKIGAYQAYGFLSVAGGSIFGGMLSGLYGNFADKKGWYQDLLSISDEEAKKKSVFELGQMLEKSGVNLETLNQQLWDKHDPWMFWVITGLLGLATFIALRVYLHFIPSVGEALPPEKNKEGKADEA